MGLAQVCQHRSETPFPAPNALAVHNRRVNQSAPTPMPLRALGVTLAAQIVTTASLSAPAVLAPLAAPALGQSPERIGWFTGLAYFTAMFAGLFAGQAVARRGAIRLTQAAVLASALGLTLVSAQSIGLVLPAAIMIGLAYGSTNPAAADLLARHTPAHRRGLYFSLKQTGVPLGVALAGFAVSALLPWFSWSESAALLALPCLAVALLSEPARRGLEARAAQAPGRIDQTQASPLAVVLRDPRLRILGLISFAYAGTQVCFVTFLVSYLHLELAQPIATAALMLSASQLVSTLARVAWGYVSDRWIQPSVLLGLLGLTTALGMLTLAILPAGSGGMTVAAVTAGCAATAVAWNGVFFAEVSHRSPPDQIAQVNGGTQFVTFCGAMLGPILFGVGVGAGLDYRIAIACCGILPLAAGGGLLIAERRR